MAYVTIMKYGDYEFSPAPTFSLEKEITKAGDGTIIGSAYSFTLAGTLIPGLSPGPAPGSSDTAFGSFSGNVSLQESLSNAFVEEGKLFTIITSGNAGEGTFDAFRCYPRINTVSIEEHDNNWYLQSPYSIALEYDVAPERFGVNALIDNTSGALGAGLSPDSMLPSGKTFVGALGDPTQSPFVDEVSESWEYEINEDPSYYNLSLGNAVIQADGGTSNIDRAPYVLAISHSISANGKKVYGPNGLVKPAWQQARDYVLPLLGTGSADVGQSGVLNLCGTGFDFFNHNRTVSVDELGGGYSVEENWAVFNTGLGIPGNATENWTTSIDTSTENGLTSIKIDGTVQGYETKSYGSLTGNNQCAGGGVGDPSREYQVTETKHSAASGYFNIVKNRLLERVRTIAERPSSTVVSGVLPINPSPTSSSINHELGAGTIQYSYSYDDRPSNHISGALSETISISDSHPTDVFAEIQVLGRRAGPILQAIGTTTSSTRDVSVEAIMSPATGGPVLDAGVSLEGGGTDYKWAYLINALGDKVGIDYPYESGALVSNTGNFTGGPRFYRDYTYGSGPVYNGGIGTNLFYNNPKPQVNNLINIFYFELLANGNKVFKSADSESWDPKNGRYSRNVSFTYQRCV